MSRLPTNGTSTLGEAYRGTQGRALRPGSTSFGACNRLLANRVNFAILLSRFVDFTLFGHLHRVKAQPSLGKEHSQKAVYLNTATTASVKYLAMVL